MRCSRELKFSVRDHVSSLSHTFFHARSLGIDLSVSPFQLDASLYSRKCSAFKKNKGQTRGSVETFVIYRTHSRLLITITMAVESSSDVDAASAMPFQAPPVCEPETNENFKMMHELTPGGYLRVWFV